MTRPPEVEVHPDAQAMAEAAAGQLLTTLSEAQQIRGTASVVLTGGRNGIAVLSQMVRSPEALLLDFGRLDVWWGDERFLPDGDPDRNETQAREALLDRVQLDPPRVRPMPALDGLFGTDVDQAAEAYATMLDQVEVPFDVLLLGVGPDGHVASLFPGSTGVAERERSVVGVREAPKPPPVRISLTLPAIRSAREVWLLAAGPDKAEAVARLLSEEDPQRTPASGVWGRERTRLLLDREAAAHLAS
ncbi:6-phosphogluconolactonase [Streptomyces sp. NPDC005438]|uniref:6-phosphogluconolactonase n=1 Tax=Streptomyces sp. NPDC005438 TaxID=3156880 RepID=UPI0033B720FC